MEEARFDHVAHAGPSIRALLPLYAGQLGGRLLYGGANERVGYRGVMLGFADGSQLELLDPLPGSTFLDSFLARNAAGGLHHVTFRVPDVRAAIASCERDGFDVVGAFLADPDWQEAFVHPRSGHGALIQLLQAPMGVPAHQPGVTFDDVLGPE